MSEKDLSKMFGQLQICIGQLQVMQNVQDKDFQNLCRSIQKLDRQVGFLSSQLADKRGKQKRNSFQGDKKPEHTERGRVVGKVKSSEEDCTSMCSDSSQAEMVIKKKTRSRGYARRKRHKFQKKQQQNDSERRDSEAGVTLSNDDPVTAPMEVEWTMSVKRFEELPLVEELLRGLRASGTSGETPTRLQQLALPALLESETVTVETAQTLDGKPAAIALAALHKISGHERTCQVLVVSSARDTAKLIFRELVGFSTFLRPHVSCHMCVGGTSVRDDVRELELGAHVVVGTLGRMVDLVRRNAMRLATLRCLVVDELDMMVSRRFDRRNVCSLFTEIKCDTGLQSMQKILFYGTKSEDIVKLTALLNGKKPIRAVRFDESKQNVEEIAWDPGSRIPTGNVE